MREREEIESERESERGRASERKRKRMRERGRKREREREKGEGEVDGRSLVRVCVGSLFDGLVGLSSLLAGTERAFTIDLDFCPLLVIYSVWCM